LSTGVALCALALCACAGSGAGMTAGGDRVLVADPNMISIKPGATGTARFVLTSGGVPIAGQKVMFNIANDPGSDSQGATLVPMTAVTDASGVASVDVHTGGATTLKIRATSGTALPATLTVVVALGTGSVTVSPFFAPDSTALQDNPGIDVYLVENQACAETNLFAGPDTQRDLTSPRLPASGGTAFFPIVNTADDYAVAGRAVNTSGNAIAVGCVDVPGSNLVADRSVAIWLPLRDVFPSPIGTFTLTSRLDFNPPLPAAAAIAAPWRDLSDCPLDPAQLFLDCIADALSAETAADPLDCKPNPAPGGEGPLGDLVAARRGVPIVDGTGTTTACRSAVDASGAPSLDAIAQGLFGSPTPALVVDLPAIATDATHIFDTVLLTSTLTVDTAGLPDQYVVTHTLARARFASPITSASADVDLVPLALPVLTAYTTAATRDGLLVIDNHGFSLRLGRAARAGFPGVALQPRGVMSDVGGMIAALAALARSDDGEVSGCAAYDRVLCAALGSAAGCLATACPAGLGTLAARLDGAFDAADGTGLDFYLSGSAHLVDPHNDGVASMLGGMVGNPTENASWWSIDLWTATGRARVAAPFSGVRN